MIRISKRVSRSLWCIGLAAGLSACGSTDSLTRTFGLTRDAPDEFQVTTRAPLSMPPSFALRAPSPGTSRPQELPYPAQAEATLMPESALSRSNGTIATSSAEAAMLAAAGPTPPSGIRDQVDQAAALDRPGRDFTDRLLFWRPTPPSGTVVDPTRESQRLHQNAALGQAPQAGDTPIIQKQNGGLLDGLF